MKPITKDAVSQIIHTLAQDSTSTTGAGKTGLTYEGVTAFYLRSGGALTSLTVENITTLGTWDVTDDNYLGFKLLHDTNAPGGYELHLPDNILATGADRVTLWLKASGAVFAPIEIDLRDPPVLAQTVDGVTVESVLECLLAFMLGKAAVVDNGADRTITFYKQNGTTGKFQLTAAEADGARAATGSIDPV